MFHLQVVLLVRGARHVVPKSDKHLCQLDSVSAKERIHTYRFIHCIIALTPSTALHNVLSMAAKTLLWILCHQLSSIGPLYTHYNSCSISQLLTVYYIVCGSSRLIVQ